MEIEYDCEEVLARINYILSTILSMTLVATLILFYYYANKIYGNIYIKNYINFAQLIIMPAIVGLPFVAGTISNIKTAQSDELKDEILALISNILLIIADILSIIILRDAAYDVLNHSPRLFDVFYKLRFYLYPIAIDNVKASIVVAFVFISNILTGTKNFPSIICSCFCVVLNISCIVAVHCGICELSEEIPNLIINLLLYGNLILSTLSVIFAILIEDC